MTVLILTAMMLLTLVGCGGKKNSDAGYYILTSMGEGEETLDEELLKQIGMYGKLYIELREDKTGVICIDEEAPITWEPGVITGDGESVNYTLEGDVLTLEMEGSTMTFIRSEKGAAGDTSGSGGADSGKLGGTKKEDDDESGVSKVGGGKKDSNTDPMVFGDYVVQYKDACLMEDWNGDDAIVIKVDFTNNSGDSDAFDYCVGYTAYQNGEPLPYAVIYTNEELYESLMDSGSEYAEPGETVEVYLTYTLLDLDTEVEVEFGEWLGDPETSITIDPAPLERSDIDSFTGGVSGGSGSRLRGGSSGDALLDFWNGDWYGWWMVTGGCYGAYEDLLGSWWDACGVIDIGDDYTGTIDVWDDAGDRNSLICSVDVSLNSSGVGEYGTVMSEDGLFIKDEVGEFDYVICLRPWGVSWDDMDSEDLPYSYEDWYLPLIEWGESMPDAIGD